MIRSPKWFSHTITDLLYKNSANINIVADSTIHGLFSPIPSYPSKTVDRSIILPKWPTVSVIHQKVRMEIKLLNVWLFCINLNKLRTLFYEMWMISWLEFKRNGDGSVKMYHIVLISTSFSLHFVSRQKFLVNYFLAAFFYLICHLACRPKPILHRVHRNHNAN